MSLDRRLFLQQTLAGAVAGALLPDVGAAATLPPAAGAPGPGDAEELAAQWDIDRSVTNLENAYWGVMLRAVEQAFLDETRLLNRRNVLFVRNGIPGREYDAALERVRTDLAQLMQAPASEFAFARNGTEALQCLITQYARLRPGDAVLYADLDYDEMQQAMESLRDRRSVTVRKFAIPEPATTANILAAYERELREAPASLKLLLVTHLSNRTGVVMPVREIVAMARARGVDTIVDAAQTIGHVDFTLADLDADFVGFSLHKWLAAPIGTGAIWIRAARLADIEPCMGSTMYAADDTRSRTSIGTVNPAATLTVPAALAFHRAIGGRRKQAHLQSLREQWVHGVRDLPGMQILTPEEPARYGAVTSFRLPAMRDHREAQRMAALLLGKHRILTVARRGIAGGSAVRVTPALYNTRAEVDRLVEALRTEAAGFR
ncbi:MAG: aminotransferase class V-fold PLP-dependent enzyme [Gemmatimonadaceae bacterium]|nr:aminotransferase class V-fold PLP-dependent enzyme [Gemmatimonadaceae bacterium]